MKRPHHNIEIYSDLNEKEKYSTDNHIDSNLKLSLIIILIYIISIFLSQLNAARKICVSVGGFSQKF